ncbi:transketolase [Streptomyces sp. NBC_00286]|uniref:transketolase n=1 Tax=Streptomyces sp. NBC_00286 TaxID=2975701 RepID=UPI002E287966|nr:transketolase [Streptomyces sp. NBC_00286]
MTRVEVSTAELAERAHRAREAVLAMGATEHGTHVGGSLSAVDILTVLYGAVLRVRPDEPEWPDRDWFVLSKGHASAALYAVLAGRGYFPIEECHTYGRRHSRLAGHPLRRLPGVDFPTGSLGHGLSLGAGVALAAARTGRSNRAFVLLGDGELQEGSNWEAIMSAAQLGLGNLTAVVDRNGWQISGRTEESVGLEPLADRWRHFGWTVVEIDGHDLEALRAVLGALPVTPGRPTVVLAKTVKGRGVPIFEDRKKSHYVKLTPRLHERALAGLRARRRNQT